ncbi:hypothetical protein GFV12_00355 [Desulfurobacterium thermolithotrophum]|uniref:hypothetical protein n=1 Tax=Desulfurobacterium thermolithotrophum TaxID=64160 RepID=UPI0013D11643|nr:hypothetical protein [Desulfurobacterium thermolithotrophum]
MTKIKISVKITKTDLPSIYNLKPSEAFDLFKGKLFKVINQLPPNKVTNRAVKEIFKKEGKERLEFLEKKFKELDCSSLEARKVIYNSFHRVFQRLRWAEDAGREKEIELRVWATSSVDFLYEVVRVLGERE